MKPVIRLFAVLGILASVACAPVRPPGVIGFTDYRSFTVQLQARSGPDRIDVKSGNQGCSQGRGTKRGCVRFDPGEIGTINFALSGEEPGAKCADPGTGWVITSIKLSSEGDSDTEKGVFGVRQPDWLVTAFPGADAADGVVYAADRDTGSTSVAIIDLNNHRGEAFVYYEVSATHCETGQVVTTDPMIQNKGRSRA